MCRIIINVDVFNITLNENEAKLVRQQLHHRVLVHWVLGGVPHWKYMGILQFASLI